MPNFSLGYTLAELLVTLVILGTIATFTIPKVLTAQATIRSNAMAKEAISIISGAYEAYQFSQGYSGTLPDLLKSSDLKAYINFAYEQPSNSIDYYPSATNLPCGTASSVCLKLHNGGVLYYHPLDAFCPGAINTAVKYVFDPDGSYSNSTADGPSKAVVFWLYRNGKIRTWATAEAATCYYNWQTETTATTNPLMRDPSWFHWQ